MQYILVALLTFAAMFAIDKGLTKLFRSREQHRSGTAVRLKKYYGVLSLALMILGVLGVVSYFSDGSLVLLIGGLLVAPGGAVLGIYYLTHGIFYDDESFLHMTDGKAVSVQSTMEGAMTFLDKAAHARMRQLGLNSHECDWFDETQSRWFPPIEEE